MFADASVITDDPSICSLTTTSTKRPLKRDDGTINTRKVHNLWYHLLHTGIYFNIIQIRDNKI